jgi:hypothetical protein
MKSIGKIFSIIIFTAALVFMAASCGGNSTPSGTYNYSEVPSWTITFSSGTFIMFVPASVSPSGQNVTANGTFTISGKNLLLNSLDRPMSFTITNSKTLTESDGSVWKKQ